jgi:predicted heme/steroid binding protein
MKNYFSQIKISRFSAWVLLATMLLYFVSGYGMTKGIIDRQLATLLHKDLLPFIVITVFTLHVSISVKYAFMRWRIWNGFSKIGLIAVFALFYCFILYFAYFYQPIYLNTSAIKPITNVNQNNVGNKTESTTTIFTNSTISPTTSETTTAQPQQKTFTAAELAKFDGKNGNPAYAAVDGVVYDLSSVFRNGDHQGYSAGQNLTDAFHSQHMTSILERFSVVGIFK